MNNVIVRQGDMTFLFNENQKVKGLNAKKVNKLAVGLGEVTGHSHDVIPLDGGEVICYTDKDIESVTEADLAMMDSLIFEVRGTGAIVGHEDHNLNFLKAGFYVRTPQFEEDPFTKAIRQVAD